uniref:Large ribosomal subunit protein mL49 n=1 Tax=Mastacembelus armatus TaxID=205130 RepID=A0A3Q3ME32_9TELE
MAASLTLRRALRGACVELGSLRGQRFVCDAAPEETRTGFLESTEEYGFVERLIPPSRIPAPPKRVGPSPSGWTPPADSPPPLPYMIRRSRMHNIPVYTDLTHGSRRTTLVRKVEGDIWFFICVWWGLVLLISGRDIFDMHFLSIYITPF